MIDFLTNAFVFYRYIPRSARVTLNPTILGVADVVDEMI